ncbi:flagellar hook-length control protein FliK [Sandaracinobacteroides saxicola]|uniref:Flagellar hook-length control protein FliK n=1 Tax=Sandaracinobacteroides saxicola TaxID=2759707 RepID=A0A7G5IJZ3_9SPHN|nr:flagellar hook-length control protein FliK [Sandaracinobacteroides saxicola]QMW23685.1 flagellar hook-length control protein FliK [Sandaracinobacteroides saxicola]
MPDMPDAPSDKFSETLAAAVPTNTSPVLPCSEAACNPAEACSWPEDADPTYPSSPQPTVHSDGVQPQWLAIYVPSPTIYAAPVQGAALHIRQGTQGHETAHDQAFASPAPEAGMASGGAETTPPKMAHADGILINELPRPGGAAMPSIHAAPAIASSQLTGVAAPIQASSPVPATTLVEAVSTQPDPVSLVAENHSPAQPKRVDCSGDQVASPATLGPQGASVMSTLVGTAVLMQPDVTRITNMASAADVPSATTSAPDPRVTVDGALQTIVSMAQSAADGRKTVRLRLLPESLGGVEVRIVSNEGRITEIRIVTDTSAARDHLLRDEQILRSAMDRGTGTGAVQIETRQAFDTSTGGGTGAGQGSGGGSRGHWHDPWGSQQSDGSRVRHHLSQDAPSDSTAGRLDRLI